MAPLLLAGDVDNRDEVIADLESEVESLKAQLAHEKQAGRDGARAVAALRKQLAPLYQAIQAVFGQIDVIAGSDAAVPASGAQPDARMKAVWDSWKDKLGVGPAKMIDALLLHGELNTQQLSIATGYHRNTVPQYVSALNTAGLIHKNAGKFSLKQL